MKKSKNEVEFVEFKECHSCRRKTEAFCVSCKKWFCLWHIKDCVQCEQLVCKECYINDLCCLVRPWRETTEEHLRNFYENKLFDGFGMNVIAGLMVTDDGEEVRETKWNNIRKEVMKRSVEFCVDNFDSAFMVGLFHVEICAKSFPRIT